MLGLWCERMNGVFQFHRSASPCFDRLRPDERALAGAEVAAVDRPALALGVDDVRVAADRRGRRSRRRR